MATRIKRVSASLMMCSLVLSSWGQMQQGYVKTLGRPDKKGVALSGVSVRVKGGHNAVLSKADGTFSVMMTGKKVGDAYSLQQVQKSGYELNEMGVIGRQYAFSDKVPLTIVMVSKSQLQSDKQRIENNAYQVAEKNYKAKLALLEKQKEENAISIEVYRQQIQDLQDKFEKYQSLIDGLADHYAHVDYDDLDEKEREINLCIENGELERADSLIHTLFDPVDVLKRNKEALAKIEQQETQAHDILAQANADMAAVLKQQEKDAEYLYQLYTISLGKFDHEKAQFYIKTRAELDTTNILWQQETAFFCDNQNQYLAAVKYYERSQRLLVKIMDEHPGMFRSNMEATLTNLGLVYLHLHWFEKSEASLMEALNITKELVAEYPDKYEQELSGKLLNLGNVFFKMNQFDKCEKVYKEALELQRKSGGDSLIDKTLYNLATLYHKTRRFPESEAMFAGSLDIRRRHAAEQGNEYDPELADNLVNFSDLYVDMQRYDEGEQMLKEALDIYQHLVKENPQVYEPEIAKTQNNLGKAFFLSQRFAESEASYQQAFNIYKRLAGIHFQVYEREVAMVLDNLATLYKKTKRIAESEAMYRDALNIRLSLAKAQPTAFEPDLANTYYNLGQLLVGQKRYAEAIDPFREAAVVYRTSVKENPGDLPAYIGSLYMLSNLYLATDNKAATYETYLELLPLMKTEYESSPDSWRKGYALSLGNQSMMAIYKRAFIEAEQYAREGIHVDSTLHVICSDLAAALLLQGKYTEAEKIYRQYKVELKDGFLDDFRQFAEAGVIPPECEADVEKIKRMLNEEK